MSEPRYLIGIDLGTTHTALAFLDLKNVEAGIRTFQVPQLVDFGQLEERPTLPSVLFLPTQQQTAAQTPATKLAQPEWFADNAPIIGNLACELGAAQPDCCVQSAKSWLCHPLIDRHSALLPWQSQTIAEKISPVRATELLLDYLRRAWNRVMANNDHSLRLEQQAVVVTVPASFDPVARNLTLGAINSAGISNVAILEEPQAAFYDYLARYRDDLHHRFGDIATVLVVDIGGGTTDFSLIGVQWPPTAPVPELSRMAVGPHVLIGGDNLDLAVAHHAEAAFRHRGVRLSSRQWLQVLQQSRTIKEHALQGVEGTARVAVVGTGSRVIGNAAHVTIDYAACRELLLNGFFPPVSQQERPAEEATFGISEAGLPYSRDPAVTRHLAAFLEDNEVIPDAVLFNGGTLQVTCLQERLLATMETWFGTRPRVLDNPRPGLAVAHGAVAFGIVRRGHGLRVVSGHPVSLYLGIGGQERHRGGEFVPEQLICLLPKGTPPEQDNHLAGKTFGIDLSRDVAFYLYYTESPPRGEKQGRTCRFNPKKYRPLPPLRLQGSSNSGIRQVELVVMLRETGFLQVACHGVEDCFHVELRFDRVETTGAPAETDNTAKNRRRTPINRKKLVAVETLCQRLLAGNEARALLATLFKDVEEILEAPRHAWDVEQLRMLYDLFRATEGLRDREEGLSAWFRMLGYCLRPGFGAPGDGERLAGLLPLLDTPLPRPNVELWSDFWIMWKRIAAGLPAPDQEALLAVIEPLLFPPKKSGRGQRALEQHERNHLWRLLGHLERLPVPVKERLGHWILQAPGTFGRDALALYALGRLGARDLSYASPLLAVPQTVANDWASALLQRAGSSSGGGSSYLDWAMRELARKIGDRLVQIDDLLRKSILEHFIRQKRKKSFTQPLIRVTRVQEADFAEFSGESLPSGFVWVKDSGD